jgi:hypothetical protein
MTGCHYGYTIGPLDDLVPFELAYLAPSLALNREQFLIVYLAGLGFVEPREKWTILE